MLVLQLWELECEPLRNGGGGGGGTRTLKLVAEATRDTSLCESRELWGLGVGSIAEESERENQFLICVASQKPCVSGMRCYKETLPEDMLLITTRAEIRGL